MSKTKKIEKEHYELLYIIPNNFTEEEAGQIQEKVKKQIQEKGGETTYEENWGKKKLAYPINHFNHGYYALLEFDAEKEDLAEINRFLKLLDEILRFLIIKKEKEDKNKVARERKERRGKEEKKEDSDVPFADPEPAPESKTEKEEVEEEDLIKEKDEVKEEKEEAEKAPQESKEEKKEDSQAQKEEKEKKKEKVDMDELDKKLDDILNTDDLL